MSNDKAREDVPDAKKAQADFDAYLAATPENEIDEAKLTRLALRIGIAKAYESSLGRFVHLARVVDAAQSLKDTQ